MYASQKREACLEYSQQTPLPAHLADLDRGKEREGKQVLIYHSFAKDLGLI